MARKKTWKELDQDETACVMAMVFMWIIRLGLLLPLVFTTIECLVAFKIKVFDYEAKLNFSWQFIWFGFCAYMISSLTTWLGMASNDIKILKKLKETAE